MPRLPFSWTWTKPTASPTSPPTRSSGGPCGDRIARCRRPCAPPSSVPPPRTTRTIEGVGPLRRPFHRAALAPRVSQGRRTDDGVSLPALGFVEAFVRADQDVLGRLAIARPRRRPDRHRHAAGPGRIRKRDHQELDAPAKLVQAGRDFLRRAVGDDDRELLASLTRDRVRRPEELAPRARDGLQQVVSRPMPLSVVEVL